MAVKFKVVKRNVLNGAEKDSVKNYAIAKTSGTSDLNKLCKLICCIFLYINGCVAGQSRKILSFCTPGGMM